MSDRVVQAAVQAYPAMGRQGYVRTQFLLVRGALPTVTTAGGPYVYVSAGLIRACEREEDLAAAMSYALAHLALKDVEAGAGLPTEGPTLNPAATPMDRMLQVRFAQWDARPGGYFFGGPGGGDRAAARVAMDIYAKGGWDPARFAANRALAGSASAGGTPAGASPAARQDNLADPETFAEIRQTVAEMPPVAGTTADVLALLPACYGNDQAPERAAARAALAERIKPPPPPTTTPPVSPQ